MANNTSMEHWNMSLAVPEAQPHLTAVHIISMIICVSTTSVSLLAYILVLYIVIVYFKEFESTFYYFIISLSLADMTYLSFVQFYAVPCTVLQRDISMLTSWTACELFAGIMYFVECTHLAFIGVYRLVHVSQTSLSNPILDFLFQKPLAIATWILLIWGVGLFIPVFVHIAGCKVFYNYDLMSFEYRCQINVSVWLLEQATLANKIFASLMPTIVAVSHLAAWYVVIRKRNHVQAFLTSVAEENAKQQKEMLTQFTLISTALIMYDIAFWMVPYFLGGTHGEVLVMFFAIVSTAVNPYTYLSYNQMMKTKAREIFKKANEKLGKLL